MLIYWNGIYSGCYGQAYIFLTAAKTIALDHSP